jgi:hypothetical protein
MKATDIVTALSLLVALAPLAGCEGDGDGFRNGKGPRNVNDCVRTDAKGNQTWFSVPLGHPCPK